MNPIPMPRPNPFNWVDACCMVAQINALAAVVDQAAAKGTTRVLLGMGMAMEMGNSALRLAQDSLVVDVRNSKLKANRVPHALELPN